MTEADKITKIIKQDINLQRRVNRLLRWAKTEGFPAAELIKDYLKKNIHSRGKVLKQKAFLWVLTEDGEKWLKDLTAEPFLKYWEKHPVRSWSRHLLPVPTEETTKTQEFL